MEKTIDRIVVGVLGLSLGIGGTLAVQHLSQRATYKEATANQEVIDVAKQSPPKPVDLSIYLSPENVVISGRVTGWGISHLPYRSGVDDVTYIIKTLEGNEFRANAIGVGFKIDQNVAVELGAPVIGEYDVKSIDINGVHQEVQFPVRRIVNHIIIKQ